MSLYTNMVKSPLDTGCAMTGEMEAKGSRCREGLGVDVYVLGGRDRFAL